MVAGPSYEGICSDCVLLCVEIIEDETGMQISRYIERETASDGGWDV